MNTSPKYLQWVLAFLVSSLIAAEKRIQQKLTQFPQVFHQNTRNNKEIVSLLSSILLRRLRPSLFIGTRPFANTISALIPKKPSNRRFREVVTVSYDGAKIALDWELPDDNDDDTCMNHDENSIRNGPIHSPVILILHGVNNDTSSGYVRRIMHSCTEMGYIAVGMNSRGSGGIDLGTPRLHNAAYTNDLR